MEGLYWIHPDVCPSVHPAVPLSIYVYIYIFFFLYFSYDDVHHESGFSSLVDRLNRQLPVVDYFYFVIQSHYCRISHAWSLILDPKTAGAPTHKVNTMFKTLKLSCWHMGDQYLFAFHVIYVSNYVTNYVTFSSNLQVRNHPTSLLLSS